MELKKTLFGGYQKSSVDTMMNQWAEEEERKLSQIRMLENELKAVKESVQKNADAFKQESDLKDETLAVIRKELVERKESQRELEGRILSKEALIAQLEAKLADQLASRERYEESIRKIGMLYVDAKDYADSLKVNAQTEIGSTIDRIFEEVTATEKAYTETAGQIKLNREKIEVFAGEIGKALQDIREGLRDLEQSTTLLSSPFGQLDEMKKRLKRSVASEISEEPFHQTQMPEATSHEAQSEQMSALEPEPELAPEPASEPEAVAAAWEEPAVNPADAYEKQIAELRGMIESQKELLVQMKTGKPETDNFEEKAKEKEKKASDKEDYDKYFAEIEKKYLKNRSEAFTIDLPSSNFE